MDINYPVLCPLMGGKEIDINTCFDIHMVVSSEAPEYTAPQEIYRHSDYRAVCNACPNHRND